VLRGALGAPNHGLPRASFIIPQKVYTEHGQIKINVKYFLNAQRNFYLKKGSEAKKVWEPLD
jgi:hypothetical protein